MLTKLLAYKLRIDAVKLEKKKKKMHCIKSMILRKKFPNSEFFEVPIFQHLG